MDIPIFRVCESIETCNGICDFNCFKIVPDKIVGIVEGWDQSKGYNEEYDKKYNDPDYKYKSKFECLFKLRELSQEEFEYFCEKLLAVRDKNYKEWAADYFENGTVPDTSLEELNLYDIGDAIIFCKFHLVGRKEDELKLKCRCNCICENCEVLLGILEV